MDRNAAFPALVDKPAWKVNALPDAICERYRVTEPAAVHFLILVCQRHDVISAPRKEPRVDSRGALAGF
jgi:hypothetical protein